MWKTEIAGARRERIAPAALAWLLLPLAIAVAAPLTLLLALPLGRLAFPPPALHYWAEITAVRKPAIQAGYPLAVLCVVAYVLAILAVARRELLLAPRLRRAVVAVVQLLGVALIAICWRAQRQIVSAGARRVYFTSTTLLVAALLAALAAVWLLRASRPRLERRHLPAPPRWARRVLGALCIAAAVVATAVWVLPAVYTDDGLRTAPDALFLGAWFLDESSAVLNGRSPLVDMAAYGNLWPYLVAIPMRAFGATYATFTTTMAALTGVSLLALFGVLLRVTRRAAFALALYLPVVGMSFFMEAGTTEAPYSPGNYYGMFPLRYAGPCLLALATALHLGRDGRSRLGGVGLLAAGGLVTLNNLDFGGGALAGTFAALVLAEHRLDRRALGRLGADLALGLAVALGLVSLLTLLRAGSLPHLGLLGRYGRIFVVGGNGNLALPVLGLHVVIALTFVAALASAGARAASRERDGVLTGMLAWSGMFGLVASAYYYAYRSHPDVLINLFPIWALALALLVVAVRARALAGLGVGLPAIAVLFGFGLAACSIAQLPDPWVQARRIEGHLVPGQPQYYDAGDFRATDLTRLVAARTRHGERVLVLSPTGHRVAQAAGVVNVSPYPGLGQMPTREQLHEALVVLQREGGTKVFVCDRTPPQLPEAMVREGYRPVGSWPVRGWPSKLVVEYRAVRH